MNERYNKGITLGCYPDEERWKSWSLDAYKKLVEYLEKEDK